jgi:hypothetical protein
MLIDVVYPHERFLSMDTIYQKIIKASISKSLEYQPDSKNNLFCINCCGAVKVPKNFQKGLLYWKQQAFS